jgi:hypothetical protein
MQQMLKWHQRLLSRRSHVVASRNVSNSCTINTSRRMWLLKESILKATVSKGFLLLLDFKCGSCPGTFRSYHINYPYPLISR